MEKKLCQSCAMPMTDKSQFGTNKDGSLNEDYCVYCYKDGEFTKDASMEDFIKMNVQFAKNAHMTEEEMRNFCSEIFPTLKRWKKN